MESFLVIAVVAFFVGALVGITGVGAGALMTPLLISVFGFPVPVAIATDLLFASVTKLMGVGFHHREGNINWGALKTMWFGSIPGVLLGAITLVFLAELEITRWLVWPLAFLVFATAFTFARRAIARGYQPIHPTAQAFKIKARSSGLFGVLGGFGIGLAVALTSVGAGALGMVLLVKLSPSQAKPQELVGTDLAHAIPIALIAGAVYTSAGLASWSLLGLLLAGSLPGVISVL